MFLERIYLKNFKNYDEIELDFTENVVVFTGNNGAGKTNLLDAIHCLCLCKSYFNPIDYQSILFDQPFYELKGFFKKDEKKETVYCKVETNKPKIFKKNKKKYIRLSDHIGLFPVVMIAPVDLNLIMDHSDERRKFIDNVIAQYDKSYLIDLLNYSRILSQRNALLKKFAESRSFDDSLLETLNEQLIPLGERLCRKRDEFVKGFIPVFQEFYNSISAKQEEVSFVYDSKLLGTSFKQLLITSLEKDKILQRTTTGIHRDDFIFLIGEYPVKRFGSQGQKKSYVLALKLAKYDILKTQTGIKPILLLDDLFDRLDRQRIMNLLSLILGGDLGQIFLTDTQQQRIEDTLNKSSCNFQTYQIEKGKIV